MRWIAIISGLVAVLLLLSINQQEAKAAKPWCELGKFCLSHSASKNAAGSGEVIVFGVDIQNNLNNDATGLRVVYTIPRQLIVRSASAGGKKVGDNRLVWRVKRLVPGQSLALHIRAEVLSYAGKKVSNTIQVFVANERSPWLSQRLGYTILDRTK